jgi:hypothetical protein
MDNLDFSRLLLSGLRGELECIDYEISLLEKGPWPRQRAVQGYRRTGQERPPRQRSRISRRKVSSRSFLT